MDRITILYFAWSWLGDHLVHHSIPRLVVVKRRSTSPLFLPYARHSQVSLQFCFNLDCRTPYWLHQRCATLQHWVSSRIAIIQARCARTWSYSPFLWSSTSWMSLTGWWIPHCTEHGVAAHRVMYCTGCIQSLHMGDLSCQVIHKHELRVDLYSSFSLGFKSKKLLEGQHHHQNRIWVRSQYCTSWAASSVFNPLTPSFTLGEEVTVVNPDCRRISSLILIKTLLIFESAFIANHNYSHWKQFPLTSHLLEKFQVVWSWLLICSLHMALGCHGSMSRWLFYFNE